jgi:hypothetical protein
MRRHVVPALFLAAPVMLAAACSSTKSSAPDGNGPTARFTLAGDAAPKFLDVPFPTDAYLANGKVIDPVPGLDTFFKSNGNFVTHELAKLNGFGRIAMALFYVDDLAGEKDDQGRPPFADIDPASLPIDEAACVTDASSVYVVDLEATDPAQARVPCRSTFHDDSHHLSKTRPMVAVGPARGIVLSEGHKYAVVLTSRLKDKKGNAVAASADFAKIAAGKGEGPVASLYATALDKVRAALGTALATDGATIVSMAPYTTSDMTKEIFKLRDTLDDAPAPTLAWDAETVAPMGAVKFAKKTGDALPAGFTASLDEWLGVVDPKAKLADGTDDPDGDLPVHAHDKIAALGTAVFKVPNYLQVKPGGYDEIDHATFAYDAAGNIVPAPEKPEAKIWVSISVPDAKMPPEGFPAVVVQHGINGSRAYLLELANVLASKGWIAVAIDSVTFGARAATLKYQVDKTTDYATAPGATYTGPDGISDEVDGSRNGSFDLFGGLKNVGAIRDQFRQSGLDAVQLVRMLKAGPDLSPLKTGDTVPKVDPTRIAYLADSLGAMEGTIAAALEPSVRGWAMNVVGGGLFPELAANSPSISFQLSAAGALNFGLTGDYFSESHVFVTLAQTAVDPGDPLSYAQYLVKSPQPLKGASTKPRHVLQIQCLFDEVVSNEANEAYARAAGFKVATPNVGSNSGIRDLKSPATNPRRVPLESVDPDQDGTFHDTPVAGVTALVVQQSPAQHGADLVTRNGHHQFAIPFAKYDTGEPFTRLDKARQFDVAQDYLGTQGMVTRFLADAIAGEVPKVTGFKAPVRDFDGDGATDDVDAEPANPKAQ